METNNIYLPLQFNQLLDLLKNLSLKEKQQVIAALEEETLDSIPEWQKSIVTERVDKYDKSPELMINEKEALENIESF